MKQIFIFEKPLNAHILKTIDLRNKILNELQLTIQNQSNRSIFEETKNIFIDFFEFVDDSKTEIDYHKIYKNLNEIYLKHSKKNMKFSTLNKNISYKTITKNYSNHSCYNFEN